ncbi:ABC transporter substrate-binding protein [Actinacidiphila acididurans]|uniref:Sugar ABC transporter substrate-binding protein n=1 Tax=Actinacidiphila acididurans TaxID=2784346 RepID=A0ABS2U6N2_9ACTN|nr:sugar ABC transporter substrate-binding protein [Actinacidiphila acididurans]MBM9510170.1 sugar ABC transporter substrate-binding protein [Actinacidiphila acididurans]
MSRTPARITRSPGRTPAPDRITGRTAGPHRRLSALAAAAAVALLTAACGTGSGSGGGSGTLTETDYYDAAPQNSQLPRILDECGSQVGVKIEHQQVPRAQFLPKLLQQASARSLPDLALIDNPDLQQVAATGGLVSLSKQGLGTDGLYPSIVAAGQYQGQTYGIAPGVNGLALYYNTDLFRAAGLKPPTTWDELRSDARTLTKGTRYGIAFSAVGNEEGSFQFEPFFWTAGASLTRLDSPQAVQALTLWKDLVSSGSASKSVVNWTQADVNDQFAAGNAAMMVNGPWQLPTLDAKQGLHFGIVPIPVPAAGGTPVTPLGGEVWTVGHSNPGREAKAVAVVKCLLGQRESAQWASDAGYIPSDRTAAAQLATDKPQMAAFVREVGTARARTAELGTAYPKVSQALADAVQAALAGGTSPQAALAQAQRSAHDQ